MDEQQFWSIIEAGGAEAVDDPEQQLEAVRMGLGKLAPAALIGFNRLFNQKMADAYSHDLWDAAYLINGGCSDDGFAYFRAWLISRGRKVYTAAVQNPDGLAVLVDPDRDDYEFEELWYAARMEYEERMGEDMPPDDFQWPSKPKGKPLDMDDDEEVAKRLPALAKLYLDTRGG